MAYHRHRPLVLALILGLTPSLAAQRTAEQRYFEWTTLPGVSWPRTPTGATAARAAASWVIFDVGCELHGYLSDTGRTFPVSGHFTGDQRAVLEMDVRVADAMPQRVHRRRDPDHAERSRQPHGPRDPHAGGPRGAHAGGWPLKG